MFVLSLFCLPAFFLLCSSLSLLLHENHLASFTKYKCDLRFNFLICTYSKFCLAGFIKSPLSQIKLTDDDAELYCEVIGNPIPEVQWWFIVGEDHNETYTQLYDGAWDDRVHINATYITHATSTIHLTSLFLNDSGTYECRASNDPDRNELKKTPKIKWIRSQANVIVIQSE